MINPDTGEIEEWVTELLTHLDSYAELSPSGTGLHIIVIGQLENGIYEFVDSEGEVHEVEVYSGHPANRFMTFTLKPYPGYNKPIQERQNALEPYLHRDVL